jgi:hypothetical protein
MSEAKAALRPKPVRIPPRPAPAARPTPMLPKAPPQVAPQAPRAPREWQPVPRPAAGQTRPVRPVQIRKVPRPVKAVLAGGSVVLPAATGFIAGAAGEIWPVIVLVVMVGAGVAVLVAVRVIRSVANRASETLSRWR